MLIYPYLHKGINKVLICLSIFVIILNKAFGIWHIVNVIFLFIFTEKTIRICTYVVLLRNHKV